MKSLIKKLKLLINSFKIWKLLINLDKTVLESSFYFLLATLSLIFFHNYIAMNVFAILIIFVASISIYSIYIKKKNPSSGIQKKILDFLIRTEEKSKIRYKFDL